MKAFDTDVLTEILMGNSASAERIANVPPDEQSAPVVAIEEILRGRPNVIRQAESGKARITIDEAYGYFEATLDALRELRFLSFTRQAVLRSRLGRSCDRRIGRRGEKWLSWIP